MANNFSLGARKMAIAGTYAAKAAARDGLISFSYSAGLSTAWKLFSQFSEEYGIKKMELITHDLLVGYGQELAMRVEDQDLEAGTAQGYVSAVNTIMRLATQGRWNSVSATKDCSIPKRSFSRINAPVALDRIMYLRALDTVRTDINERGASIIELCREIGLRSKEASLLDARKTMAEASKSGFMSISAGTKGGRDRMLKISTVTQVGALERACVVQGDDRSMIPAKQSWKQWREGDLREIREAVQMVLGGEGLHDLRSSYACERYEALTGFSAPVCGGERPNRDADRTARLQITKELGHGRIDVTNAYLGGQKR